MTVTDDLREYTNRFIGSEDFRWLRTIADRIDAEYETAVRKKAAKMLTNISEYMSDEDLDEIGLVRLPPDANDEPIHVGDVMDGYGKAKSVIYLLLDKKGWIVYRDLGDSVRDTYALSHHHEPTVEDVLREFGEWYLHAKGGCDEDGIVADFAKRLRLVGDAE